eukprot:CAMPEP_0115048250 /NCGR_PEP_ID=MMETSP0227-20121206/455_1 /TAXON_ID=89957 /ORGANISM="Polarella glacialis, Strain CCMP 1383" /LENGTH=43 /DNA_ID= /DNA_START= /DNA_END= /DNA_ORIENTATION=
MRVADADVGTTTVQLRQAIVKQDLGIPRLLSRPISGITALLVG